MTPRKPLSEWQRDNTPDAVPFHVRRNIIEGSGGCWLWTRSLSPDGYGWASLNDRTQQAHRLTYMHAVGPVPDGLVLDHLCRVRHCVNPAHLEPVTPAENLRRSELTTAGRVTCKLGHTLDWRSGGQQRYCRTCEHVKFVSDEYRSARRALRARQRGQG